MPQCMHEGHRDSTEKIKKANGKTETVHVLSGWNSVHRRFEICDPGLIPPRKPGTKKELRRAEAD